MNALNKAAEQAAANAADQELLAQLAEDIDFARLTPGQTLDFATLARRLRTTKPKAIVAARSLAPLGLISINADSCTIALVERDHLLPRLDVRLVLEQQVAEAAAARSDRIDRAEIEDAAGMLERCALIGDIDGYMRSDRRIERAIAAAANMPEVSEQVFALKSEFRRAWCAYNRLRDLKVPAAHRQALVSALLIGDATAAKLAIQRFIEYLRQSY
jgi:DNA-binding GntR family transcriptional regulator